MTAPSATTIRERVWKLIEPVCTHNGYELVDVRFVTEPGGWVLRVFIDLPEGEEGDVDLDDCERMSRELSALLDVEDPIAQAYSLEISSPGIDRPLVTPAHFRRFVGAEIKATLHHGVPTPQGGDRKNFRGILAAVEGEGDDAHAKVIVDGAPWLLPIRDVDVAKIVPDWDAVMRGDRGQVRPGEPPKPHKKGRRPFKHD
jgi:ribosome maturation factor RimP